MSTSQQRIRTIRRGHIADFDEQMWPVTVALLMLAGFLVGWVVGRGDFEATYWLDNAWTQLGIVALLIVVLLAGVSYFRGRARRRLQLGVLLSLLLHLGLVAVTQQVYLTLLPETDGGESALPRTEAVRLPDYTSVPEETDYYNPLERPTNTVLPRTQTVEVARAEVQQSQRRPDVEAEQLRQQQADARAIDPAQRELQPTVERQLEIARAEMETLEPREVVEAKAPAAEAAQTITPQEQMEIQRQQMLDQRLDRPDVRSPAMRQSADTATAMQAQRSQQASASERALAERQLARAELPQQQVPIEQVLPAPQVSRTLQASDALPERMQLPVRLPQEQLDAAAAASGPRAARVDPNDSPLASVERAAAAADAANQQRENLPRQSAAESELELSAVPMQAAPGAQSASERPALEAAQLEVARRNDNSSILAGAGRSSVTAPSSAAAQAAAAGESGPMTMAPVVTSAAATGSGSTGQSGSGAQRAMADIGSLVDTGVQVPGGAAGIAAEQSGSGMQGGPVGSTGAGQQLAPASGTSITQRSGGLTGSLVDRGGRGIPSATTGDVPSGTGAATTLGGLDRPGVASPGVQSVGEVGGGPRGEPGLRSAADERLAGLSPTVTPGTEQSGGDLPGGAGTAAGPATGNGAGPSTSTVKGGAPGAALRGADTSLAGPRQVDGGLPSRMAGRPGAEGTGHERMTDLGGLPGDRARLERSGATVLATRPTPGRRGDLLLEPSIRDIAVPGYKQRDPINREAIAKQHGGSEGTERAVELGLEFLARHQLPDGRWSLHDFAAGRPGFSNEGAGSMRSDTAATGMALLAFLGAGYTHVEGKYEDAVHRGLNFLLINQRDNGDLFKPEDEQSNANVWLYSHGIAAIALCEAYGLTRDEALRDPAQRGLDFIVAAQHPDLGGWRYSPQRGSDTSVSGWQLMALKSGELAGLGVPRSAYQGVQRWLDGAQASQSDIRYVYMPGAEIAHQRTPSRVMTAEALLMRQYLGWQRNERRLMAGADYLGRNLPSLGSPTSYERDAYYWYYATQVMFHMQGTHWQEWNESLRPLLVNNQEQSGVLRGSWDPLQPSPDRWGVHAGRIYVTSLHLLMLEVYYRHLPLYRTLED